MYFLDCETVPVKVQSVDFSPDPGKMCIFPFTLNDEQFNGCTEYEYNGVYWCPTELSVDGSLSKNSSKWGVCGDSCPKDSKSFH